MKLPPHPNIKPPRRWWLTHDEIAAWLGVGTEKVRRLVRDDGLPRSVRAGVPLYHVGRVSRWLEGRDNGDAVQVRAGLGDPVARGRGARTQDAAHPSDAA